MRQLPLVFGVVDRTGGMQLLERRVRLADQCRLHIGYLHGPRHLGNGRRQPATDAKFQWTLHEIGPGLQRRTGLRQRSLGRKIVAGINEIFARPGARSDHQQRGWNADARPCKADARRGPERIALRGIVRHHQLGVAAEAIHWRVVADRGEVDIAARAVTGSPDNVGGLLGVGTDHRDPEQVLPSRFASNVASAASLAVASPVHVPDGSRCLLAVQREAALCRVRDGIGEHSPRTRPACCGTSWRTCWMATPRPFHCRNILHYG